jgi:hypothetical protein
LRLAWESLEYDASRLSRRLQALPRATVTGALTASRSPRRAVTTAMVGFVVTADDRLTDVLSELGTLDPVLSGIEQPRFSQKGRPPCTLQLAIGSWFDAHAVTRRLVMEKWLRFGTQTAARRTLSNGPTLATRGCTSPPPTPSFTTKTRNTDRAPEQFRHLPDMLVGSLVLRAID